MNLVKKLRLAVIVRRIKTICANMSLDELIATLDNSSRNILGIGGFYKYEYQKINCFNWVNDCYEYIGIYYPCTGGRE